MALSLLASAAATAQEGKDHNFKVAKNIEVFNAIYRNLDMMYVDSLDADEVIGNGINAMLRSLDPYTVYYPESEVKSLKMMLTGKYAGIGALIRYNARLKRVVIDEPYANTPAAEAGLKKGDIILSIRQQPPARRPRHNVRAEDNAPRNRQDNDEKDNATRDTDAGDTILRACRWQHRIHQPEQLHRGLLERHAQGVR